MDRTYVSEFTQFINRFLEKHPEVVQDQWAGRGIFELTDKYKAATPVNWHAGEDVIIVPSVKDEEARNRFPEGWKAPKPYLRIVAQPH